MTGDAIDQAKWRVIAAQALREDIDRELAKLIQIASLVDKELRDANEWLTSLTDSGATGPENPPSPVPTRLSMLREAVEDSKPLTGILRSAVERTA